MPEKLPVPTEESIKLLTQDVGSVFQGKMNSVVVALRNALIAFNAQIDAAQTASQQVEPAPEDVALEGTNNTYKMTPLRSAQLILKLLTAATTDREGALDEVAGKLITAEHSAELIRKLLKDAIADEAEALTGTSDKLINTLLLDLVLEWRLGTTGNLGTAAQRNVMTSLTDATTLDALMPRGAYGYGGIVQSYSGNVDSITIPNGLYLVGPSNAGAKPGGGFWTLEVIGLGDRARQIWRDTSETFTFERQYNQSAGVWRKFERCYTSMNIIGSVYLAGDGLPSGSIFESGVNPNGYYVKFANKLMIETKQIDNMPATAGSIAATTITWPSGVQDRGDSAVLIGVSNTLGFNFQIPPSFNGPQFYFLSNVTQQYSFKMTRYSLWA